MNELQNKKISVSLMLFSFLGILTAFQIKKPYDYGFLLHFEKNNMSVPLSEYYVEFMFINFSLDNLLIFLVIFFGFGLYSFIFKNDETLKSSILPRIQLITKVLKNLKSRISQFNFSLIGGNKSSDAQFSEIKIKQIVPKYNRNRLLLFSLKYIIPLLVIIISSSIYLGKPLNLIDRTELLISIKTQELGQVKIMAEEDYDYSTVYLETLMKSNAVHELIKYKGLKYARDLLNKCDKNSLTLEEKEILNGYNNLNGYSEMLDLYDNYDYYVNLANFTILGFLFILIIGFMVLKKERSISWPLNTLILYCLLHAFIVSYNNPLQKDLDKTLRLKYKLGCLQ